jgi:hypothetical protein
VQSLTAITVRHPIEAPVMRYPSAKRYNCTRRKLPGTIEITQASIKRNFILIGTPYGPDSVRTYTTLFMNVVRTAPAVGQGNADSGNASDIDDATCKDAS